MSAVKQSVDAVMDTFDSVEAERDRLKSEVKALNLENAELKARLKALNPADCKPVMPKAIFLID